VDRICLAQERSSAGVLWTRWWTFGFHQTRGLLADLSNLYAIKKLLQFSPERRLHSGNVQMT